jgi:hypothetical protein
VEYAGKDRVATSGVHELLPICNVLLMWRGFIYSKVLEDLEAPPPREGGGLVVEVIRIEVPLGRLAALALRCTRASTSSSVLWARNPRGVDRS